MGFDDKRNSSSIDQIKYLRMGNNEILDPIESSLVNLNARLERSTLAYELQL